MNSLKNKITASTLAIFLIGLWSLSLYTSTVLQKDIEELMGNQQFSIVSRLAAEVNNELEDRFDAIEKVAAGITPAMLGNTTALQKWLEERPVFQSHFNGGAFVTLPDGTATASVPLALGRRGTNYMERDHLIAALKEGKTAISKLAIGKKLNAPVFSIATPIHDAKGALIGALVGVIDLGKPNFLDRITESHYGRSGGYVVIAAQERRIITASDKSRIMEQLPTAGVNPVIDRFLDGYEGAAMMVNPAGEEMLAADKGIPVAGWIIGSVLPTAEAFAPVRAMQRRLLLASTLLTLLASAITWWILRRHLTPLIATAKSMVSMADRNQPLQPLPVFQDDEIGQLTIGFNGLIETITRREEALRASDETLRSILATTLDGFWRLGPDGALLDVNPTYSQQSGYSREELLSMRIADLEASEPGPETQRHIQRVLDEGHDQFESVHRRKDGSTWAVEVSTVYTPLNGGQMFAFLRDITERKSAQDQLAQSERRMNTILEGAADAIYIVDPQGNYQYVNQEAIRLLGYSREEMLGMNFSDIARTEDLVAVRKEFATLLQTGSLRMEYWLTTKSGSPVPVELNATRLPDGNIFGSCRDITERKRAEEKTLLVASVFTHAREGIMITAPDGTIMEVNDTFTDITGFTREEVVGQNPRILSSGRQPPGFYDKLWRDLEEKGHWSGEVWNRRKNGEVYAEMQTIGAVRDTDGKTQQYVALFSDITRLKEQQRQLEHLAHYDALTNLPNRVLLADRLHQSMAQAQRRGQQLAVTYLDIDGFKSVNDDHGHGVGDQLLITLAARLKQVLRDGDTLARMGGDEFVVVLVDLEEVAASVPVLTRLLAAAAQPVTIGDEVLQVTASLGVTFYPQADEVDADQLLRQADQAMYQAKLAGKHRYHVFDADQDRTVRGHHEDLDHIRTALAKQEFVLYYQPKVDMRQGTVIGAEALIRWQHPDKGLLSPAMFLPAIEDDPLALELGEWVINTALTQLEIWHAAGLTIPVSVNIGAHQLQHADFIPRLREILARHPHVKPGDLELEVLETSALEDLSKVFEVIETCRAMDIGFALDDFGTGYSSLTYLKRLPVTVLKIDQSFVRDMLDDPDDLTILDGVIGLATAFRREVIAEGVETVEHGEMLLQLGCDYAQGYGIARPMPAQDMPAWTAIWQPDPKWRDVPLASRNDLPLLFACVEHRAWIKSMEHYLHDKRETPPPLDHHKCPFGIWLENKGAARYRTNAAFANIETLHLQAHVLASELHALKTRGQSAEARARLAELRALSDALLKQLKGMVQGHPA